VERPAAGFGKLSLQAEPWARVFIDGAVVGETPLLGLTLPAGRHSVRLENPVYRLTRTLVVDIEPNGALRKFVDLNADR
jgi:serine/threonine-protein kinase